MRRDQIFNRRVNMQIHQSGYPESPSELEIITALDSRLRGNDGRMAALRHTRESGYPECMV